MPKWKLKLQEFCQLDLRSLAVFRIGMALIILGDLAVRFQDLQAHYTDSGVLPRQVLIDSVLNPWNISIHLANGTWQFQAILFLLAALSALAMLLGFRTRLATILSWVLLVSLQNRNPMILQGGDIALRVFLFWSMFLPLGAYWSWDQRSGQKPETSTQVLSIASVAFIVQVCSIYFFTSLLKTDASWRGEGTAIWYALSIEQYTTPFGTYLLQFPALLKVLTHATMALEFFGPLFLFSPIGTAKLRLATAFAFIGFHVLGLNLTMELAHFPYVCAAAWFVLVPGWFWDRLFKVGEAISVPRKAHWLSNVCASLFLLYVLLWNIKSVGVRVPWLPPQEIGSVLRIDQYWNMFAPYPYKEDGWYVMPAKLMGGTELDLFSKRAVTWDRPPHLAHMYSNDRWRSFLMNIILEADDREVYLLNYGRFLCRSWNESHFGDQQLVTFSIDFMRMINTYGSPPSQPVKNNLWSHSCFDTPST